jgi:hypothetical protein
MDSYNRTSYSAYIALINNRLFLIVVHSLSEMNYAIAK